MKNMNKWLALVALTVAGSLQAAEAPEQRFSMEIIAVIQPDGTKTWQPKNTETVWPDDFTSWANHVRELQAIITERETAASAARRPGAVNKPGTKYYYDPCYNQKLQTWNASESCSPFPGGDDAWEKHHQIIEQRCWELNQPKFYHPWGHWNQSESYWLTDFRGVRNLTQEQFEKACQREGFPQGEDGRAETMKKHAEYCEKQKRARQAARETVAAEGAGAETGAGAGCGVGAGAGAGAGYGYGVGGGGCGGAAPVAAPVVAGPLFYTPECNNGDYWHPTFTGTRTLTEKEFKAACSDLGVHPDTGVREHRAAHGE